MASRPRRLGQTKEGAAPLLRMVNGKQHAREGDHEEAQQKVNTPRREQPLEDINAEPADSDEELNIPKPSRATQSLAALKSSTGDEATLKLPPGSSRKRPAESPLRAGVDTSSRAGVDTPLRRPPAKKTRNSTPIIPKKGHFEQNRAAKGQWRPDKENTDAQQTPPASSASTNEWGFSVLSSQTSQRGPKKTFKTKKTENIHATPRPVANRTKGKSITAGSRSKQTPQNESHEDAKTDTDTDTDDVSLMSDPLKEEELSQLKHDTSTSQRQSDRDLVPIPAPEPHDPELRSVPSRKRKNTQPNHNLSDSTALTSVELDNLLKPTLREQLGLTNSPASSPPPSSAPQEAFDTVNSYVRDLPPSTKDEEEGTACPLCHSPIAQDTYWAFWKGRHKTVKNQSLFCHSHRLSAARAEYSAQGYPPIDWAQLPSRIKSHRTALLSILTNDPPPNNTPNDPNSPHPNPFRTHYTPLALTGRAASLRTSTQTQTPDSPTLYPGYYGPRGRRIILETVMTLLDTAIKRCDDPVVQSSGPATFVQAVLVPEVAIRLIMEDLRCEREEAEGVRVRSCELGGLVNEEVEDVVGIGEEEGDSGDGERGEYGL